MLIDAFAFNILTLSQASDSNIKGIAIEQFLPLAQVVDQNFEGRRLLDVLYISQKVDVQKILNVGVHHTLTFVQDQHPRVLNEIAFQFLSIQQYVVLEDKWPQVTSFLALTQLATATVGTAAANVLTLTQSVGLSVTRNLSVTHTLALSHTGRTFIPSYYWTSYPIVLVNP